MDDKQKLEILERRIRDLESRFGSILKKEEQDCLWDGMPETYPGSGIKIAGLSCPCSRCTPRY